ncbi:unnamed protein product [Symbiodinium natans]|uniref:DZANK-type domain-containing protein n=1 Tax=Symbiodinium natans TaxID=878477 RepID=A0A812QL41_9DINO|nr:unnamed protein product [Symbiodinium natans]
MVPGLAAFLELARLGEYRSQAGAFCNGCGAIEVREVLEDEDLCDELAQHLQLKPLEAKRFKSLAAEVRADPRFELVDPEEEEAESVNTADEVSNAQQRSFRTSGWNSKRGIRSVRGGRGRGGLGHYFDSVAEDDRDVGGSHHPPPRSHAANPYFSSPVGESSPGEDVCERCGSRNTGRRLCFDCGAERALAAAPVLEVAASRGGYAAPSAQAGKAAGKSAATAPKRRFCISCGAQQLPHAKFCSECGSRMDEPAERPAEPSHVGPAARRTDIDTRPSVRAGGGDGGGGHHYFEAQAAQTPKDEPSLAELRAEVGVGDPFLARMGLWWYLQPSVSLACARRDGDDRSLANLEQPRIQDSHLCWRECEPTFGRPARRVSHWIPARLRLVSSAHQ